MIEFVTAGPDAEARAAEITRALTAALGHRPTPRRTGGDAGTKGPFEAITIALMIPPALVATLDLAQRIRMLDVVERLLGELPPGTVARRGDRTLPLTPGSARALLDLVADAPVEPLYDVFVSSAAADDRDAEELATALRWQGLKVFSRGELLPGDVWTDALWNAQRTARATAALVSATADGYADEALVCGLDLKRSWDHAVVPVYRDGLPRRLDDVPPGLRALTAIDLAAVGPDAAAEAIARALKAG